MSIRGKFKKSNVGLSHLENSNVCVQHRSPSWKTPDTIPTGRQLPRTPVKRTSLAEKNNEIETRDIVATKRGNAPCFSAAVRGSPAKDDFSKRIVPEHRDMDEGLQKKMIRRPSTIFVKEKQPEEINPDVFIEGMVGYQWTQEDLEFVENTKNTRLIQKQTNELDVLLKQLEKVYMKKEIILEKRKKFQTSHPELAAFDLTMLLARDFLSQRVEAAEVEALEPEFLLAQIQGPDVQRALHQERAEVAELEIRWATAQNRRKLQEKQSREAKQQDVAILQKQAKVDGLNTELSELKMNLLQAENALQATQKQMKALKVPESVVDESEVDMTRVMRRVKRIERRKQIFLEREKILRQIHSVNCLTDPETCVDFCVS